jgi:hypothetical protein
MTEKIHDHSRVDAFMAARRRAMVLHALWRPLAAGAIGAALVIGAVWVTLPKISYREVEVPRVTMRDVTVPNIVPHDVQVDHLVPHDVEIDIPRIATPLPGTPSERAFVGTEGWRDAVVWADFALGTTTASSCSRTMGKRASIPPRKDRGRPIGRGCRQALH